MVCGSPQVVETVVDVPVVPVADGSLQSPRHVLSSLGGSLGTTRQRVVAARLFAFALPLPVLISLGALTGAGLIRLLGVTFLTRLLDARALLALRRSFGPRPLLGIVPSFFACVPCDLLHVLPQLVDVLAGLGDFLHLLATELAPPAHLLVGHPLDVQERQLAHLHPAQVRNDLCEVLPRLQDERVGILEVPGQENRLVAQELLENGGEYGTTFALEARMGPLPLPATPRRMKSMSSPLTGSSIFRAIPRDFSRNVSAGSAPRRLSRFHAAAMN